MSEYLWDRKIRVTVYKQGLTTDEITQILASTDDGLEEGFDRSPTQTGILKFEIDQELPIEFEITKTLGNSGKNNSASLRIYNISEDTAKTMGHQMLTVKIEVAYRGMPLTPIFFYYCFPVTILEVSMRRLLCKKVYEVERLWCYSRYYTANITGLLYVETRKFFITNPIHRSKGSIYRRTILRW